MSSTTSLQLICPVVIDSNLEVALIDLNKSVATVKGTFNIVLLDAVDSAFSTIRGFNSEVLYSHLKSKFGINREAIPDDVVGFAAALEETFGVGALLIEIEIMKSLHCKLSHIRFSPKQNELCFSSYLEHGCSHMNTM